MAGLVALIPFRANAKRGGALPLYRVLMARRFHFDSIANKTTSQRFRSSVKLYDQTGDHEPTPPLNFDFSPVPYLARPNTKARHQKHKATKARSIVAKAAKELEARAGSETGAATWIFESVSDNERRANLKSKPTDKEE